MDEINIFLNKLNTATHEEFDGDVEFKVIESRLAFDGKKGVAGSVRIEGVVCEEIAQDVYDILDPIYNSFYKNRQHVNIGVSVMVRFESSELDRIK